MSTPPLLFDFPSLEGGATPSHLRVTSIREGETRGNPQIPRVKAKESHERGSWKSTSRYRSASVISPNFNAVETASPRLVEFSFLKTLCRCVSTDGAFSPSSKANRLVVSPLAIPRRICISLEVRATVVTWDKGDLSATRLRTSGIILRGTGLSLRTAAHNARCSSPGPESFKT